LQANSAELLGLYRDADIFCLPTLADASPIAAVEAMASGLPVVVSNVGGIPELVDDGETGLLVRPNDADDLGSKLQVLLDSAALRLRMGAAGRRVAERELNVERLLHQIVATVDADEDRCRADGRPTSPV
jgi:glycosyltransferase involved in cell wall biosynthesis